MEKPPFPAFPEGQKVPVSSLLSNEIVSRCPRFQREGMGFRASATKLVFDGAQAFLTGCDQMQEEKNHHCKELPHTPCPIHGQCGAFRLQFVKVMVDEHPSFD
ncbi:MAG: hypothetical protein PHO20_05855 [Candidatus Peribacteraceae bacterium]|nr:hypothetical protein [Candidatus Peribacteraceae bacterium]MDD5740260.1 hypothetical protein [Candidatus Peribacteraceae bacterium]